MVARKPAPYNELRWVVGGATQFRCGTQSRSIQCAEAPKVNRNPVRNTPSNPSICPLARFSSFRHNLGSSWTNATLIGASWGL
jgi:hypothetical protein